MGCNLSKIACGCGNHIVDRDGKEYCLPSCQTEASIEKAEREFLRFKARQLLAVKKGHLKARGYKRGRKPPDIKRQHQAPMKPIKNFLGLDTVEAIFNRLLPTVVNGKQVRPSLSAEKTIASTDKEAQVENNNEALPEKISGSPLEPCNQDNQKDSVKRASVKKYLNGIFRIALDEVRTEELSASRLTDQSLPESLEQPPSLLVEEDISVDKNNVEPNLKSTADQEMVPVPEKDLEDSKDPKDDQLSLVFVNWEEVNVSVDSKIKMGPKVNKVKILKDSVPDISITNDGEHNKDNQPSLVLVNWEEVMVDEDAEIKMAPEVKESKVNEVQAALTEQEESIKIEDDDHVMVSWDQVEVSVDAQIKVASEVKRAQGSLTEASAEQDCSLELEIKENKEIKDQTPCPLIETAVEEAVVKKEDVHLIFVKWGEVKVSVDAEVKRGPNSKELVQEEQPVEKKEDIPLTLVRWEEVKVSVDAEVKQGPKSKELVQEEQPVEKKEDIPLTLVRWEEVKVSVDAEVKQGPKSKELVQEEQPVEKKEDIPLTLVRWEEVKVSVDAEVKRGPKSKELVQEEQPVEKKEDILLTLVRWKEVRVSVDAEVKQGPKSKELVQEEQPVEKKEDIPLTLVRWEDVKVSVDAEVKQGPKIKELVQEEQPVEKKEDIPLTLVRWEEVKVSVDAEVKQGPKSKELVQEEQPVEKKEDIPLTLVRWEEVKVSVDAEVKQGPKSKELVQEEQPVEKKEDIPLTLVRWEEVKVSVDAEVKQGPKMKELVQEEQPVEKKEDIPLTLVRWKEVKVSVDAEVKQGPKSKELVQEEQPVEKKEDIPLTLVRWKEVKVSVDAEVKQGPKSKELVQEEQPVEKKEDIPLTLVRWEEVKVSVDAEVKQGPKSKELVQEEQPVEKKEDIPLTLVRWEEVKVSVDAEVKQGPKMKELVHEEQPVEKKEDIPLTLVRWEEVNLLVDAKVKRAYKIKSENQSPLVKFPHGVDRKKRLSFSKCQISIKPEIMQECDVVEKQKTDEILEVQKGQEKQKEQEKQKGQENQDGQIGQENLGGQVIQEDRAPDVYQQQFVPESEEPVATGGKERAVAMGEPYALTCSPVDVSPMATASNPSNLEPIDIVIATEEPASAGTDVDDATDAAMGNCSDDNESNAAAVRGNYPRNKRANDDGIVSEKVQGIIDQDIDDKGKRNCKEKGENELSKEEEDEEVLISEFIPVFIDKEKDVLDHTSRDESIPLAENEILDLLSTVITDNEIQNQIARSDSSCSFEGRCSRLKSPNNGDNTRFRNPDGLNVEFGDYRPSEDTETGHEKCIKKNNDDVNDIKPITGETTIARPSDEKLSETAKRVQNDAIEGVRGSGDSIGGPANGTISKMISLDSLGEDTRRNETGEASVARPGNVSNFKAYSSESNEKMSKNNDAKNGEAFNLRPEGESSSGNVIKYAGKKKSKRKKRERAKGDDGCVRPSARSCSENAKHGTDERRTNHAYKVKDDDRTHNPSPGEGHKTAEGNGDGRVYSSVGGRTDTEGSIMVPITTDNSRTIPLQEGDRSFLNNMDETCKNQPEHATAGLQHPLELDSKCNGDNMTRSYRHEESQVSTGEDKRQSGPDKNPFDFCRQDLEKGQKVSSKTTNIKGAFIDDSVSLRPMGNWIQRIAALRDSQKRRSEKRPSLDNSPKVNRAKIEDVSAGTVNASEKHPYLDNSSKVNRAKIEDVSAGTDNASEKHPSLDNSSKVNRAKIEDVSAGTDNASEKHPSLDNSSKVNRSKIVDVSAGTVNALEKHPYLDNSPKVNRSKIEDVSAGTVNPLEKRPSLENSTELKRSKIENVSNAWERGPTLDELYKKKRSRGHGISGKKDNDDGFQKSRGKEYPNAKDPSKESRNIYPVKDPPKKSNIANSEKEEIASRAWIKWIAMTTIGTWGPKPFTLEDYKKSGAKPKVKKNKKRKIYLTDPENAVKKEETKREAKSSSGDKNEETIPVQKVAEFTGKVNETAKQDTKSDDKEKNEATKKVAETPKPSCSTNPPPIEVEIRKPLARKTLHRTASKKLKEVNPAHIPPKSKSEENFKQQSLESVSESLKRLGRRSTKGNCRYSRLRKSEDDDAGASPPASSRLRSHGDKRFEKDKNSTEKDVKKIQNECDAKDIMLAILEFNKVRQALGLNGPVSTALVYKFLHARYLNVDDATRLYKNYLSLRRMYYNADLSPLKDPLQQELFSGSFTVLDARDESGAAIAVFTQLHNKDVSYEVVMNNIYLQLDEAIKSHEIQQDGITLIYDFFNVSYKKPDVRLCSKILELFLSAYPVGVKKTYIVSPPYWFVPKMRLLCASFRDANKRKDIHIVTQYTLKNHLPVTCIPRRLGGECWTNPLKLIDLCLSSYKERAALVDTKDEDCSNNRGDNTIPREDHSSANNSS